MQRQMQTAALRREVVVWVRRKSGEAPAAMTRSMLMPIVTVLEWVSIAASARAVPTPTRAGRGLPPFREPEQAHVEAAEWYEP